LQEKKSRILAEFEKYKELVMLRFCDTVENPDSKNITYAELETLAMSENQTEYEIHLVQVLSR
jgi:hypothetical protein